jgi:hypothetical protein
VWLRLLLKWAQPVSSSAHATVAHLRANGVTA